MPEESTTPDPVELARKQLEAVGRRDFDVSMSFCAPDAVFESMGMATSFEGLAAIRGFFEDFVGAYEEYGVEPGEILDLGNGLTLSMIVQHGRPVGSSAHVQMRFAAITTWVDGLIKRSTFYTDVDEARAAAERLAEERG